MKNVFLDKDYAALMKIGEIMRTRGGHLKYVLVNCYDGKFVSSCLRSVFVTTVPTLAIVYPYTHACTCVQSS